MTMYVCTTLSDTVPRGSERGGGGLVTSHFAVRVAGGISMALSSAEPLWTTAAAKAARGISRYSRARELKNTQGAPSEGHSLNGPRGRQTSGPPQGGAPQESGRPWPWPWPEGPGPWAWTGLHPRGPRGPQGAEHEALALAKAGPGPSSTPKAHEGPRPGNIFYAWHVVPRG